LQAFFYFFIISLSIHILYFLLIFRRFVFYKSSLKKNSRNLPVSVIICAKDEEENLQKFLPKIYQQNYPNFEVVLIDDRSIDKTWEIMESFREKFPEKTKVVRVDFSENPRFIGNKKYALTLGIKAAAHETLLFTDADCQPASENWISRMTSKISATKQLILGYGKYQKSSGFLNKVIRYETLQTALQYFSYALIGKAYMGVGRNLAYTRKLFFDNNGFYNHLDILSGDDDLFVNEVSTAENTDICIDPESFTISIPAKSWKQWIRQKRRHISTANHYKLIHRFLLGVYYFSLLGFYISSITLLLNNFQWKIVTILIFIRFILWYFVNYQTAKKLNEKDLVIWIIFLEPFLIIFQLYIFILNLLKKPRHWN